ncbi:hypothetical protein [Anaerovorax sp. IOR16]|uniref:hypothetical protein n=1 Tax=Anaerovorax sp. IOR16 TaxID=2773458 RepID=UPI0019CFE7E7|nr:hypothetical protein [Anaerovorax sp. IOR16]
MKQGECGKNKKYTAKIEAIEDMEGLNDYIISSDKPIPYSIINNLNKGYVSINLLKLTCTLHGLDYEVIDEGNE